MLAALCCQGQPVRDGGQGRRAAQRQHRRRGPGVGRRGHAGECLGAGWLAGRLRSALTNLHCPPRPSRAGLSAPAATAWRGLHRCSLSVPPLPAGLPSHPADGAALAGAHGCRGEAHEHGARRRRPEAQAGSGARSRRAARHPAAPPGLKTIMACLYTWIPHAVKSG